MTDDPIPDAEWRTIVANVPLVSVDLVVEHDGGVLLGCRTNEPAKGEWFVPGGTVLKNERLSDAVHRVAQEELGVPVTVVERLGIYEHFYETSEVPGVDSKHYVATAFHCRLEGTLEDIERDVQHGAVEVFTPPFGSLHPYVEQYVDGLF